MTAVVLASASPRRHELLTQLGVQFTVRVPDIDESPSTRRDARSTTCAAGVDEGRGRGSVQPTSW